MSGTRKSDEQWLNAVKECRASGLSDKDWCATQGIHTATFYRAIRRLRSKACSIPVHDKKVKPLLQEVVEIASVDENGVLTQTSHKEATCDVSQLSASYDCSCADVSFESTVRIITPSGVKIELTNNSNAAIIRNILGVLRSV